MDKKVTIALLGQPNAGKSSLFNGLTGGRQHVGNWPGKSVEMKSGEFARNGRKYEVVDLPGAYALVANSEEEIVTREYVSSGKADIICLLADASQLGRSLFMLADYAGIRTPVILLLNLMDVAEAQGKLIDVSLLADKLGIPVLPFVASDPRKYDALYSLLERDDAAEWHLNYAGLHAEYWKNDSFRRMYEILPENGIGRYDRTWLAVKLLEEDREAEELVFSILSNEKKVVARSIVHSFAGGSVATAVVKYRWIDLCLEGVVSGRPAAFSMSRFDRLSTSRRWGKCLAVGIMFGAMILSLVAAVPFGIFGVGLLFVVEPLSKFILEMGMQPLLATMLCKGVVTACAFAIQMASFVFGITFVFGLLEDVGYMSRVACVFDSTMRKVGLQGKAIMPFVLSFGCNIGGSSSTRVLDNWDQKVMAIAMSWVVPCGSVWGVVGLVGTQFFGTGVVWVIAALLAVSVLHAWLTYKLFGRSLLKSDDYSGLIMELPPFHRPKWGYVLKVSVLKFAGVFRRAITLVVSVSVVFSILAYSPDGIVEHSVIAAIGKSVEPVTHVFGLTWQTFMAWLTSLMGKEASLGVLAALFGGGAIWDGIMRMGTYDLSVLGSSLGTAMTKPEALAFLFAFWFNVPCIMALTAGGEEMHSLKWTLRIAGYYIAVALLMGTCAYWVGRAVF